MLLLKSLLRFLTRLLIYYLIYVNQVQGVPQGRGLDKTLQARAKENTIVLKDHFEDAEEELTRILLESMAREVPLMNEEAEKEMLRRCIAIEGDEDNV